MKIGVNTGFVLSSEYESTDRAALDAQRNLDDALEGCTAWVIKIGEIRNCNIYLDGEAFQSLRQKMNDAHEREQIRLALEAQVPA